MNAIFDILLLQSKENLSEYCFKKNPEEFGYKQRLLKRMAYNYLPPDKAYTVCTAIDADCLAGGVMNV